MLAAGKLAGGKETSANDANMEKLVGQAKIVANKGGGEAIVKLNPEGLGEVKLKIAVKDGRVQVEMATESNEAKKMLESTVGELKHALNSQKLSVDSIKVDVGNQLASDQKNPDGKNGQDQSMNFRQDPGREQARQFFANMREESMARREPFAETGAIRDYQRPATPIAEKRASPASRYAGTGRGEKMNIVA
jgi:flagellar hook-length control protein FliK